MNMTTKNERIPDFSFLPPLGYLWLIERGITGFEPGSGLQPWHCLDSESAFSVSQRWPGRIIVEVELYAFAKRQDNDDLACFKVQGGKAIAVALVHGWTSNGYDIIAEYQSFWDWLKSVIDDIAEWVESPSA